MTEKILVVEDSRAFRNYLHQQLTNSGYAVTLAESVQQAKEILDQETDFLCAVLDYCLPDGQDGEIVDSATNVIHPKIQPGLDIRPTSIRLAKSTARR